MPQLVFLNQMRSFLSLTIKKGPKMLKKYLFPMAVIASLSLPLTAFAAEECKSDADCKDGKVCILALTPPQCKPPQPAGEPCKRDVVCASKKCDIPAGKDMGVCK
jgi:hypothetical protein